MVGSAAELPSWLGRKGFFLTVDGYEESSNLLTERCLHVNMAELFSSVGAGSGVVGDVMKSSLLSLNGEEHKRYRSTIASEFTPSAVERVRPLTRGLAQDLVGRLSGTGTVEFIGDVAGPFVTRSTCEFIGLPASESERCTPALDLIEQASRDLISRSGDWDRGMTLLAEFATEVLERRKAEPTGDILSKIAIAIDDGELPELVGVALLVALLSAGQAPTTYQLGLMVMVLSEHPDLWDAIATGGQDVRTIVEETLRIRSTNQGTERQVTMPFTYRGMDFRPGQRVILELARANHDGRRFARPDEFDPTANAGSHLAFGFGPHYCLGAALARLQLQEALLALTQTMTCPRIGETVLTQGVGLSGPTSLMIDFQARVQTTR